MNEPKINSLPELKPISTGDSLSYKGGNIPPPQADNIGFFILGLLGLFLFAISLVALLVDPAAQTYHLPGQPLSLL